MPDSIPRSDVVTKRWREESLERAFVYAQGATANIRTALYMEVRNEWGVEDQGAMKELLDSARLQRMLAVPLALTSTGLLHKAPTDIDAFTAQDPTKHETHTRLRDWQLASELAAALAEGTLNVRSFEIGCAILHTRAVTQWHEIYSDHDAVIQSFWLHEIDTFATELEGYTMMANNVLAQASTLQTLTIHE